MIIERPLTGFLSLQIWADDISDWEDWTDDLSAVQITRGGKRSGVAVSVDPGMLSATLVNAGDPATDGRVRPNAPVRIGLAEPFRPIFTGRIVDVFTAVTLDKTSGAETLRVSFTATDSAAALANTTRYGVVSEPETWAQRIRRLADSVTTDIEPPADDSDFVRYAI